MVYWWSILVVSILVPLVTAVHFHGVSDVSIGQTVLLGLEMGSGDNFKPFNLGLISTTSNAPEDTLQNIDNVTQVFTVTVTIPSVPQGFYIYCASEPDSGHIFSRSDKFLVLDNSTTSDLITSTIAAEFTSVNAFDPTPISTNNDATSGSVASPTSAQATTAASQNKQTTTLIIIGVVAGVLMLGILVLVVIYLRQRRHRKWVEEMAPIRYEPPDVLAPPPEPKKYNAFNRSPSMRPVYPPLQLNPPIRVQLQQDSPISAASPSPENNWSLKASLIRHGHDPGIQQESAPAGMTDAEPSRTRRVPTARARAPVDSSSSSMRWASDPPPGYGQPF